MKRLEAQGKPLRVSLRPRGPKGSRSGTRVWRACSGRPAQIPCAPASVHTPCAPPGQ
jgi:hypothetical protein